MSGTRFSRTGPVIIFLGALSLLTAGAYAVTLTAPTLTAPSNGATVALPVTLQWTAVSGATGYLVKFAKDAGFTKIIGGRPASGTSVQIEALPAGVTIYWEVAGVVSGPPGSMMPVLLGPWSAPGNFTVAAPPPPPALTAPTLTAPANGSTVPPPVTLSWSAVTGANAYQVQVAQDSAFTKPVLSRTVKGTSLMLPPPPVPFAGTATGTGTSLLPPSLTTGVPLYWRVAALIVPPPGSMRPVRLGPWSDVWSFTLQSPPPPPALTAPKLLAPANGSTVKLPITFSWTAVTGATAYTIQFARDKAFTQPCGERMIAGTSVKIPGFPVWSGHAQAGTGQTTTGTTAMMPIDPVPVTLYWRVAALRGPVPVLPGPQPLIADPIYIIRGPWSDVWSFTTPVVTPPPPLTAPTLITPPSGATVRPPITFSWIAVTGAAGYEIQFAKDQAFTQPLSGQMVNGTSVQLGKFPVGITLYWRVAAVAPPLPLPVGFGARSASSTAGTFPVVPLLYALHFGLWSEVSSFTVTEKVPPPPVLTAPTLLTPANGSTVTLPVTFSWTAVTGSRGYQLQFATDSAFSHVLVRLKVSGTSLQFGGSSAGGMAAPIGNQPVGIALYWRVRAIAAPSPVANPLPSVGPWSDVWSFTVGGTPPPATLAAPVLTAPADGATGVSTSPLLQWGAVTGAAGYVVEVATSRTFTSRVFLGQVTAAQKQLSGLSGGALYYWRVRAYAQGATGPWSEVWSFTTSSGGTTGTGGSTGSIRYGG